MKLEDTWYSVADDDDCVELASIDQAMDYEMDQTGIYYRKSTGKVIVMTASGCSCWCGEACIEEFDSLEAAIDSLTQHDREYNLSLNGIGTLETQARAAWAAMGH